MSADDVTVVARLAEVERELDAVVDTVDESHRLVRLVESVCRDQSCKLAGFRGGQEPDVLRDAIDPAVGDAEIEQVVRDVMRVRPVSAYICQSASCGLSARVDPAEDTEGRQESLYVDEKRARRRSDPNVSVRRAVVHATVGVEQAAEEC